MQFYKESELTIGKNVIRLTTIGIVAASLTLPLSLSANESSQAKSTSDRLSTLVVNGIGTASGPSDAELRDIRELAIDSGKPEGEIMEESIGQNEFSELSYRIENENPELFVGAGFSPEDPEADAFFIFTGRPEKEVVEQIAQLPINVEVKYGAPWSLGALEASSTKIIEAAMESPGVGSVATSLDREGGVVVVRYAPRAGEKPDIEKLLQNVTKASQESTGTEAAPGVRIIRDDELAINFETTVQGGRVLRQNGSPMCTSGFSATRNGNQGLITANHCPNSLDYIGTTDVITFGAGGYAAETDMQFHRVTSGNSAEAKFQAAPSDIRPLHNLSNPVFAEQVCKYGNTTGYGCTTIYDTGLCITNDLGTGFYCSIAVAVGNITSGGDSGGPWFWSFGAKGTHTGAISYSGATRSIFTQIGRASNHFNTTVMTD